MLYEVITALLEALRSEPYFAAPPPKSTGRDLFNASWLERRIGGTGDPRIVQATLLELTARSVITSYSIHYTKLYELRHGVLGYTVPPPALREAIVARMQRLYGWHIEADWIVFLPGVVPGLHLAARKLVRADGHALVPTPIYHHFKRAVELALV